MFLIPGPARGDALGTILKVGARFAAPPDGFGRMHYSMRIVYTTICIMYHQFSFNSLGRTGLILLLLRPKAKLKCVQMPTSDHDMSVTANGAAASATAVCVCHFFGDLCIINCCLQVYSRESLHLDSSAPTSVCLVHAGLNFVSRSCAWAVPFSSSIRTKLSQEETLKPILFLWDETYF